MTVTIPACIFSFKQYLRSINKVYKNWLHPSSIKISIFISIIVCKAVLHGRYSNGKIVLKYNSIIILKNLTYPSSSFDDRRSEALLEVLHRHILDIRSDGRPGTDNVDNVIREPEYHSNLLRHARLVADGFIHHPLELVVVDRADLIDDLVGECRRHVVQLEKSSFVYLFRKGHHSPQDSLFMLEIKFPIHFHEQIMTYSYFSVSKL